MRKIISMVIIVIICINIIIPVYADDEIEEANVTQEEIEGILETTTEIEDAPTINSKNAIIYDRVSRRNNIW